MTVVTPTIISVLISGGVLTLVAAAAIRDVIARTIPNQWCGVIALGGITLRLIDNTLLLATALALAVFAALFVCWRFRLLGGGDVKLLTACTLAVPPMHMGNLLFDTAIAGMLLGLLYLLTRNRIPRPNSPTPTTLLARACRIEQWRLHRGGPLPYAVAIALGYGLTLLPGGHT